MSQKIWEGSMERSIVLAADVEADRARVFEALTTTSGQRAFWTADCEVSADKARFGFPQAPADLLADVTTEPDRLVRMRLTSGFPFWEGSTWEWELREPVLAQTGTGVLFRHYGFGEGYPEINLGHTAQTWAQIMERLVGYVASGSPQPFFPPSS
jgi:uncharacterized protein YndB with AHSA1/START domain